MKARSDGTDVEFGVSPQLEARVITKKARVGYDVIVDDCTVISTNTLMDACVRFGCDVAVTVSRSNTTNAKYWAVSKHLSASLSKHPA